MNYEVQQLNDRWESVAAFIILTTRVEKRFLWWRRYKYIHTRDDYGRAQWLAKRFADTLKGDVRIVFNGEHYRTIV